MVNDGLKRDHGEWVMLGRSFLAALIAASSGAHAIAAETLYIHPQMPVARIFERSDEGGRDSIARARVTRDAAIDWCENWKPGDALEPCIGEVLASEDGRIYEVKADCHSGQLTSVHDDRYVYDGLWSVAESDMWSGWAKFKELDTGEAVGTSNADGGLVLSAQWRTLCPYGAPFQRQPLKLVLDEGDRSTNTEAAGHNGSGMYIDYGMGTIVYASPREQLQGLVPMNALLFRGTIIAGGIVEGVAFTFRRGCDPAPYRVEGHFPTDSDKLVLTGKAPIREGCTVVGYADESPNNRLVIDLPHH
jgi:hypothetical protein